MIEHSSSLYLIIMLLFILNSDVTFGPISFSMHIKPLSTIIDLHSIIQHLYAKDLKSAPDKISKLLHYMRSEHIGRLARMSVLDTEVNGLNPGSSMLFP